MKEATLTLFVTFYGVLYPRLKREVDKPTIGEHILHREAVWLRFLRKTRVASRAQSHLWQISKTWTCRCLRCTANGPDEERWRETVFGISAYHILTNLQSQKLFNSASNPQNKTCIIFNFQFQMYCWVSWKKLENKFKSHVSLEAIYCTWSWTGNTADQ